MKQQANTISSKEGMKSSNKLYVPWVYLALSLLHYNAGHVDCWSFNDGQTLSRKMLFKGTASRICAGSTFFLIQSPPPSLALVKGNAPPPKSKEASQKLTCVNVQECEEQRDRQQREQALLESSIATPVRITSGGTRYKDLRLGNDAENLTADVGDEVAVRYKVLKVGKRSSDGLSGEGTVIFSMGYGLEDNEPSDSAFTFTIVRSASGSQVIEALLDGIVGTQVGGIRRIGVTPQKGWEKATPQCDGGPGGTGAGGDIKTDYVVVPTATMVATEVCFDKSKLPFPTNNFAEQRRMAQRFDQSLILEVELLRVVKNK